MWRSATSHAVAGTCVGNDRIVKHITVSPDAQRLALRLVQCTCKTLVLQCALI